MIPIPFVTKIMFRLLPSLSELFPLVFRSFCRVFISRTVFSACFHSHSLHFQLLSFARNFFRFSCFACGSRLLRILFPFVRFDQSRPRMVSFSKSRGGLHHSPSFHLVRASMIHFTFYFPLHSNTERFIVGSETRRRRPRVYERGNLSTPDTKLSTPLRQSPRHPPSPRQRPPQAQPRA